MHAEKPRGAFAHGFRRALSCSAYDPNPSCAPADRGDGAGARPQRLRARPRRPIRPSRSPPSTEPATGDEGETCRRRRSTRPSPTTCCSASRRRRPAPAARWSSSSRPSHVPRAITAGRRRRPRRRTSATRGGRWPMRRFRTARSSATATSGTWPADQDITFAPRAVGDLRRRLRAGQAYCSPGSARHPRERPPADTSSRAAIRMPSDGWATQHYGFRDAAIRQRWSARTTSC